MVNQQLLEYIKQQVNEGVIKEDIKATLLQNGWEDADVEEAFGMVSVADQQLPQDISAPPVLDTSPADTSVAYSPVATSAEAGSSPARSVIHEKKPNDGMNSLTVALVSSFVAILLLGGGVFAYFTFSKLSPDEVVARMFIALGEVTSVKSATELSVDLELSSEESGDAELQMLVIASDASDFSDEENMKGETNITVEIYALDKRSRDTMDIDFNADVKVLGDMAYARLNKAEISELPAVPSAIAGMVVNILKGKWIMFDLAEIESSLVETGPFSTVNLFSEAQALATGIMGGNNISSATPFGIGQTANILTSVGELLLGDVPEFDESAASVLAKKLAPEFVEIIERSTTEGADKKIGDVRVYDYIIKMDKDDWRTVILEVLREEDPSSLPSEQEVEEIREFLGSDEFDQFFDILAMTEMELWIGKKDFLPYKAIVALEFDEFEFDGSFQDEDITIDGSMTFSYSASDYNEPVDIRAPEKFVPISDIVDEFTGSTGESSEKTHDAVRKSDIEQTRRGLELYYETYGAYPLRLDLIGEFFGSGYNLRDPATGELYKYTVKNEKQGYLLCADLDESDESFCVSSSF